MEPAVDGVLASSVWRFRYTWREAGEKADNLPTFPNTENLFLGQSSQTIYCSPLAWNSSHGIEVLCGPPLCPPQERQEDTPH